MGLNGQVQMRVEHVPEVIGDRADLKEHRVRGVRDVSENRVHVLSGDVLHHVAADAVVRVRGQGLRQVPFEEREIDRFLVPRVVGEVDQQNITPSLRQFERSPTRAAAEVQNKPFGRITSRIVGTIRSPGEQFR